MTALEARVVEALRAGAPDFVALRRAAGCTSGALRAALQRLRWAGKVEMGALRLSPSMIENSAEAVEKQPPPEVPAEPGPAQRRRAQEGAGAENPDVPAPTRNLSLRGAGALERARARTAPAAAAAPGARTLETEVREEAEVLAARRRTARATGGGLRALALSPGEQLTTMLVEEPEDAIRAVRRKWPDLWARVVLRAREEGKRPGPMMFALIERALAVPA